ncbi:MAG: ketose-bisphosphate aldolase [Gammaproteobacteria bacterium]|nr:MAG: ketose-bisphosphate aldolase [Gammaproteobacteria bacterium]
MPLVNMKDMLTHAWENGYAVGGFDLVGLEFLDGIMRAAEGERSPVILSLAESHFEYYDFELAMAASVAAAERSSVPVAIHLDHGASLESAIEAIRLGCNGVMVDASHHPFDENVAATRAVVEMAHGCGVPVEGELGYVAGVEGEDAERHPGEVVYTHPEEAERFVAETGVDFLAVSIGTVHGRMRGTPRLDFDRLAAINERVQRPLVIHGGTGLEDAQFRRLIENGVAKINYYTALADAAAERIRANRREGAGYTALLEGVREAVAEETARCMRLFGSAGQADAVLASAEPWRPVEHVIIYNVEGLDEAGVHEMMRHGREVLGRIPGVRRVITGEAVQEQARYRFAWLVEFVHPAVIKSYRDHPGHTAFADNHFRPVAGDRISIDYRVVE